MLRRFNLYELKGASAEVGYRVAQQVAGRGVMTATLRELCRSASVRYGLCALTAATSDQNVASQKVLTKVGFVPAGPADPAAIGGKHGTLYRLELEHR